MNRSLDGSGYASVHGADEGSEGKQEFPSHSPTQNDFEEADTNTSSIRVKTPPLSGLRVCIMARENIPLPTIPLYRFEPHIRVTEPPVQDQTRRSHNLSFMTRAKPAIL